MVDGRKMSKSLGNFYTLRDLLEKGIDPIALRWSLLAIHYRQPNNFTLKTVDDARNSLQRIRDFRQRMNEVKGPGDDLATLCQECETRFVEALDDDLNISGGLGAVFDFVRAANKLTDEGSVGEAGARNALALLDRLNEVTGLFAGPKESDVPAEILTLVNERQQARRDKNFARSDEIRDALSALGWILEDTPGGARVKRA
jgi:cysteinyl-tRNA synthetase